MKFLIAAAASLVLTATSVAAAYPTATSGAVTASGAKSDQARPMEVAAAGKKPGIGTPSRPANKKSKYG